MGLTLPFHNKFMTTVYISTTSTTVVTLATYTSSGGIGIIYANMSENTAGYAVYLVVYNGSTTLTQTQAYFPNLNNYISNVIGYAPQSPGATITLEGDVNGGTGAYLMPIYEVF